MISNCKILFVFDILIVMVPSIYGKNDYLEKSLNKYKNKHYFL